MDPKRNGGMWLAPGSGGAAKAYAPGAEESLPAVDDCLVQPDGGYEIVDGKRVELSPAKEAHGEQHFDLPGVFLVALAPGYRGAVDMLTRTDKQTNIAPDVSIYPAERDPVTGGRKLEELIFEVLDAQPLSDAQWRAERLLERGVRRAFAVDASKKRLFEWIDAEQQWREWLPEEFLVDRCFSTPIAVRALLDATLADDTIVQALLARKSPSLQALLLKRENSALEKGRVRELRTSILDLCEAYGIAPTELQLNALQSMELSELEALRIAIKTKRAWTA